MPNRMAGRSRFVKYDTMPSNLRAIMAERLNALRLAALPSRGVTERVGAAMTPALAEIIPQVRVSQPAAATKNQIDG